MNFHQCHKFPFLETRITTSLIFAKKQNFPFLDCITLPKLQKRKIWPTLWNSAKIKSMMNNMWRIGFHPWKNSKSLEYLVILKGEGVWHGVTNYTLHKISKKENSDNIFSAISIKSKIFFFGNLCNIITWYGKFHLWWM